MIRSQIAALLAVISCLIPQFSVAQGIQPWVLDPILGVHYLTSINGNFTRTIDYEGESVQAILSLPPNGVASIILTRDIPNFPKESKGRWELRDGKVVASFDGNLNFIAQVISRTARQQGAIYPRLSTVLYLQSNSMPQFLQGDYRQLSGASQYNTDRLSKVSIDRYINPSSALPLQAAINVQAPNTSKFVSIDDLNRQGENLDNEIERLKADLKRAREEQTVREATRQQAARQREQVKNQQQQTEIARTEPLEREAEVRKPSSNLGVVIVNEVPKRSGNSIDTTESEEYCSKVEASPVWQNLRDFIQLSKELKFDTNRAPINFFQTWTWEREESNANYTPYFLWSWITKKYCESSTQTEYPDPESCLEKKVLTAAGGEGILYHRLGLNNIDWKRWTAKLDIIDQNHLTLINQCGAKLSQGILSDIFTDEMRLMLNASYIPPTPHQYENLGRLARRQDVEYKRFLRRWQNCDLCGSTLIFSIFAALLHRDGEIAIKRFLINDRSNSFNEARQKFIKIIEEQKKREQDMPKFELQRAQAEARAEANRQKRMQAEKDVNRILESSTPRR